ncbi:hypothetical protein KSD_13350 [Ktedonobacter sp. SOSP1-85]|uniref:anti-sigma factor family protein n=1 Tax=Ktedonobacter sp. SOSP1-85 TaxID=2778367 RepID=UPI00191502D0|nr:zf-HC2 domain-containing protein [Ktedonobacter sp. SOSP1-85]GHO73564.1 hypothetical protein KSD_13350 [Ktedonobacter sp. SOSP1-85]
MKCEQVKELLSPYLDAQLAADIYQQITCHLQYCRSCSEALADFRYFDTLLARIPRVAPDASLYAHIFTSPSRQVSSGAYASSHTQQQNTTATSLPRFARAGRPHLVALQGGRDHIPSVTTRRANDEREVNTDKVALPPGIRPLQPITPSHLQPQHSMKPGTQQGRPLTLLLFLGALFLSFLAGLLIGIYLWTPVLSHFI